MRTTTGIRPTPEAMKLKPLHPWLLGAATIGAILALAPIGRADTVASLLGNFTINQYCGLHLGRNAVDVHYVIVYGQLPALRELHDADADGNGVTTQAERDAYFSKLAPEFADQLDVELDGVRVPLQAIRWRTSLPAEQGGFSLRVDMDLNAALSASPLRGRHIVEFSNQNYPGKLGWHEIVVTATEGIAVFDTNAYDNSATAALTEALAALPASGPLDERAVHLSFDDASAPGGAKLLGDRPPSGLPAVKAAAAPYSLNAVETGWITRRTRELVDAVSAPRMEPPLALGALLAALFLGAVHALSPGHGKTIVGAYLIGSRSTPRHAFFLGLTVTVTHTAGVFLLGFATFYASRFVVPERLLPILSSISALLVLGMGIVLLIRRGRAAIGTFLPRVARGARLYFPVALDGQRSGQRLILAQPHSHSHSHDHTHEDGELHYHAGGTMHSHGGGPMHSHSPPGASGERVTWKSLLTLGISGGLVPCPSAMVLLLAAVALNKTAFGMLLVLVFSVGLAVTLTLVGLAFLYARNHFPKPRWNARWPHLLPVLSAATITALGAALCVGAWKTFG